MLHIPSKDAYSYGRSILDVLFTKQEQKTGVIIKSNKSTKRLMCSLGQKCRDAKIVIDVDAQETE